MLQAVPWKTMPRIAFLSAFTVTNWHVEVSSFVMENEQLVHVPRSVNASQMKSLASTWPSGVRLQRLPLPAAAMSPRPLKSAKLT